MAKLSTLIRKSSWTRNGVTTKQGPRLALSEISIPYLNTSTDKLTMLKRGRTEKKPAALLVFPTYLSLKVNQGLH